MGIVGLAALRWGSRHHATLVGSGVGVVNRLNTTVLTACSRCGRAMEASKVRIHIGVRVDVGHGSGASNLIDTWG